MQICFEFVYAKWTNVHLFRILSEVVAFTNVFSQNTTKAFQEHLDKLDSKWSSGIIWDSIPS